MKQESIETIKRFTSRKFIVAMFILIASTMMAFWDINDVPIISGDLTLLCYTLVATGYGFANIKNHNKNPKELPIKSRFGSRKFFVAMFILSASTALAFTTRATGEMTLLCYTLVGTGYGFSNVAGNKNTQIKT